MSLTLTPAAILLLLKSFAVPPIDAHEVNRESRLGTIAVAVWDAARHATCKGPFAVPECKPIARDEFQVAAELIGKGKFESDYRSNVGADRCGPHQCDAVRFRVKGQVVIMHRARSYWQMQKPPTWTAERWESIRGDSLQATTNAAWEAAKLLAGYRGMCGGTTEGAMAGFATGRSCKHKDAARRARMVERYRWMLVQYAGKEEK